VVLQEREDRQEKELFALVEVAKTLTVHLEITELLETVMDKIDEVLHPAEFGIVLLWDPTEGVFIPRASCGSGIKDPEALYKIRLLENESITGHVFTQCQAVHLSTIEKVAEAQKTLRLSNRKLMFQALGSLEPKSIVAAPLCAGVEKYGVLLFETLIGESDFSYEDVSFVQTTADLIALAIDRSRLESQATAKEAAEQANRLRAEAMATLSHELRTPLAAIKGYSTALLMDEVKWSEDKRREFLTFIDQECDSLQTMIADILDSSLIDIDQLTLELQPVRLQHLAREVANELQRRTKKHHLVVDFPNQFPIIDMDVLRIKQVFRNIIDNSIKYSPDGGLIVVCGKERKEDVVISISDQGIGISQEDLIPLFEKYFRVKSSTGIYIPGTGLGLPVARTIVEKHKGRIWAESKVGEGTTLYFSLPKLGERTNEEQ